MDREQHLGQSRATSIANVSSRLRGRCSHATERHPLPPNPAGNRPLQLIFDDQARAHIANTEGCRRQVSNDVSAWFF